jgi:hypothetical protein
LTKPARLKLRRLQPLTPSRRTSPTEIAKIQTWENNVPKIETVRFDGRTISEVRKKFRQWYEDNRAKVSIVNERYIERLQPGLQTSGRQHQPHGHQDVYTMLVEYEAKSRS